MMEFTLSRVCMMICGVVLMATVSVPIISMYDGAVDDRMQDIADDLAGLIDRFAVSSAEIMTISLRDIIPDPSYTITFNGYLLTLTKENKEYVSILSMSIEYKTFICDKIIELKKDGNGSLSVH